MLEQDVLTLFVGKGARFLTAAHRRFNRLFHHEVEGK